jgi:hypothetical protein
MKEKLIREIAVIVENAYDEFLEAYALLDCEQESGVSSPEFCKKFDQVNRAFGELREHLNETDYRVPDYSGSQSRATTETQQTAD